jgi:hypothetical protein
MTDWAMRASEAAMARDDWMDSARHFRANGMPVPDDVIYLARYWNRKHIVSKRLAREEMA